MYTPGKFLYEICFSAGFHHRRTPAPSRHVECWSQDPQCFLEAAAAHQELLVEKVQLCDELTTENMQFLCNFIKLLDFIPRQF